MKDVDKSIDWENYLLGNVAHEMTHTRQIIDVLRRVRELRKTQDVPNGVSDNFLQATWESIPEYKAAIQKEMNQFVSAAFEDGKPEERKRALIQALEMARSRHEQFFVGTKAFHREIDNIFLSMEGPARWAQYQIARASSKAGNPWQQTVLDLLRHGDSWAQIEGLAIFLLVDVYVPNWQKLYFSPQFPSPFETLRQAVER